MTKLFTSKDGHIVEVADLAYGTLLVTYTPQGGGFNQKLPRKAFDAVYTPYSFPDTWKAAHFTGDWFYGDPQCREPSDRLDPLPGYHQGRKWNGWAMPVFEKAVGLKMIDMFPDWKMYYDAAGDCFIAPSEGEAPSIYGAQIIRTETGEEKVVYAIGAGSWTWELDDMMDIGKAEEAGWDGEGPASDGIVAAAYECPATPGPNNSEIIGCGKTFEGMPDEEGFVDCPHCGIHFKADEPGVRKIVEPGDRPASEVLGGPQLDVNHILSKVWANSSLVISDVLTAQELKQLGLYLGKD